MSLIATLPILVPLLGAPFCALLSESRVRWLTRRVLYTLFLALTAVALLVTRLYDSLATANIGDSDRLLAIPGPPLWSPLGYWAGSVLVLVLFLGQLTELRRPLTAARSMHYLVMLSATMATVSASNLISLVLAWSIPQWLVSILRASQSEAIQRVSRWDTWAGFVSLSLAVLGTVAATAEQGGSLYLVEIGPGLAFTCLAAAAGLRLVSWLLAGGTGRWWQLHAMSMVTGFYLWLRLGIALEASGSLVSNPLPFVAAILALGLLIGPREGQSRVVPYGYGYWLAVSLLAPALDPQRGFAVSLLVATQLLLCLLLLRGYREPLVERGISRLPGLLAWGTLSGLVFTSGLTAHWIFGQLCLRAGGSGLLAVASLGFMLAAVPLWSRLSMPMEITAAVSSRQRLRPPTLILIGASSLLLLLGIWPGVLGSLWPDIRIGLDALDYDQLWGPDGSERLLLLAAVVAVPLIAGFAGMRVPRAQDALATWIGKAEQGIHGEWLYLVAQRAVAWATRTLRTVLENLEHSGTLVWSLLWCIALVYYLLQR